MAYSSCYGDVSSDRVYARALGEGEHTVEPAREKFNTGLKCYKHEDWDAAIDAFLQAIYFSRNYYYPEAYYWLGLSYAVKKQDNKAIEALEKHCEQAVGPVAETHLKLGELYLRNGRLLEADHEAGLALEQSKKIRPQAENLLGMIAEKRDDLSQGQYHFLEALGDSPWRFTEAWMNYAENLMKQKQWGSAVTQLHNMLNSPVALKNLDYQKIYLDLGDSSFALGDHQGAIDNWHQVLNYNPDNASAYLKLGMLFESEHHFTSALKEYREFVRTAHDEVVARKVTDHILALEQMLANSTPEAEAEKASSLARKNMEEKARLEQKAKDEERQKDRLLPTDSAGF